MVNNKKSFETLTNAAKADNPDDFQYNLLSKMKLSFLTEEGRRCIEMWSKHLKSANYGKRTGKRVSSNCNVQELFMSPNSSSENSKLTFDNTIDNKALKDTPVPLCYSGTNNGSYLDNYSANEQFSSELNCLDGIKKNICKSIELRCSSSFSKTDQPNAIQFNGAKESMKVSKRKMKFAEKISKVNCKDIGSAFIQNVIDVQPSNFVATSNCLKTKLNSVVNNTRSIFTVDNEQFSKFKKWLNTTISTQQPSTPNSLKKVLFDDRKCSTANKQDSMDKFEDDSTEESLATASQRSSPASGVDGYGENSPLYLQKESDIKKLSKAADKRNKSCQEKSLPTPFQELPKNEKKTASVVVTSKMNKILKSQKHNPVVCSIKKAKKQPVKGKAKNCNNQENFGSPKLIIPVPSPKAMRDGLRRSLRPRVRPLQLWNGEKLIYGENDQLLGLQTSTNFQSVDANTCTFSPHQIMEDHEFISNKQESCLHIIANKRRKQNDSSRTKEETVYSTAKYKKQAKSVDKRSRRKLKKNFARSSNSSNNLSKQLPVIDEQLTVEHQKQTAFVKEAGKMAEAYEYEEDKRRSLLRCSDFRKGHERKKLKKLVDQPKNSSFSLSPPDMTSTTIELLQDGKQVIVDARKVIAVQENEVVFGLNGKRCSHDNAVRFTKGVSNLQHSMGTITIEPGQEKGLTEMKTDTLCFFVASGTIELTLETSLVKLSSSSYFYVPPKNKYNLKNVSNDEAAFIFFTQIKNRN